MSDNTRGVGFEDARIVILELLTIPGVRLYVQPEQMLKALRAAGVRVALTEPQVQDLEELGVGDKYEGEEPADCPAVSPDGYYCCRPKAHTGRHVASNGTSAVDVWRG